MVGHLYFGYTELQTDVEALDNDDNGIDLRQVGSSVFLLDSCLKVT